MNTDELRENLLMAPKNGYARITPEEREEMNAYCRRYMAFMDECKTEREATAWAVREAEKRGYKPFVPGMDVKPGDKIYYNNRDKAIALAVIGTESLDKGVNICAAHVDSPRMDVKPNPLYEDSQIAYFKTHYYGGIKKYQWPTVPLAIHGVVYRKDGTVVTVTIGEDDNDPVLMVSDLLIHLAGDQMQKPLAKGIEGEQLNVILGTEPIEGEGADLVKLNVMKWLNENAIPFEVNALSAHRTPDAVEAFAKGARSRGIKVIIAGAGMAAALPGVIAASTPLPVIGVPIKGMLDGLDAMLSIIQMPPGIPVATVGVNGAQNAAILAAEMIALGDEETARKVDAWKAGLGQKIEKANKELAEVKYEFKCN